MRHFTENIDGLIPLNLAKLLFSKSVTSMISMCLEEQIIENTTKLTSDKQERVIDEKIAV